MNFTHPCFIRKNTKELRNYLDTLGYTCANTGGCTLDAHNYDGKGTHRTIAEGKIIITSPPHYYGVCYSMDKSVSLDRIDCGTDEELFMAVASIKEKPTPIEGQCEFEIGDVIVSSNNNIRIFEGIHNDCVMSSHHLFTTRNSFHVGVKTHRQKIHEYVKATREQTKLFNRACLSNKVWFDRVNKKWIELKEDNIYVFKGVHNWITVLRKIENDKVYSHADVCVETLKLYHDEKTATISIDYIINITEASEEQKQTLFDELAKIVKQWNATKRCVENIPYIPNVGELYWYCNGSLKVDTFVNSEHEIDKELIELGNCFKSEEECQKYCDYMKQCALKYKF